MTATLIRRIFGSSFILMAGLAVIALLPGACAAPEETTSQRSVPADVDPTARVDLTGWWSNGIQLLRLDPDGRYELYDSLTRLEPPLHRGRWNLRTNERLTLEPYTELEAEPLSTEIILDEEFDVLLRVPGYPEFQPTSTPQGEPMDLQPAPIQPMSNQA